MQLPALKRLATLFALMGVAILLPSCATTTASSGVTTKTACGVFGPIEWSRKDTAFTVEEIKEHNAAGVEVCGWTGTTK